MNNTLFLSTAVFYKTLLFQALKYFSKNKVYLKLAQLVLLLYSQERNTCYSNRLHNFFFTIPRCYKDVYVNSFFPCTGRIWNCMHIKFFPFTCDLNGFKSNNIWFYHIFSKNQLFFMNMSINLLLLQVNGTI